MENVKIREKIMEIIDAISLIVPEGEYLKLCNLLGSFKFENDNSTLNVILNSLIYDLREEIDYLTVENSKLLIMLDDREQSKIINPATGRLINIDGRLAKKILKNS